MRISQEKFQKDCESTNKFKSINSYAKLTQQIDFQQMYHQFQDNVAQIVGQQRIKLASMKSKQSKYLVNETQHKLIHFLKQKSGTNNIFNQKNKYLKKKNICFKDQQNKLPRQQIFDFSKLNQIVKNNQKIQLSRKKSERFKGILVQKVVNDKKLNLCLSTNKTNRISTATSRTTNRNYLSWTAEKTKRSAKNMFNWK